MIIKFPKIDVIIEIILNAVEFISLIVVLVQAVILDTDINPTMTVNTSEVHTQTNPFAESGTELRIVACAKINLFLEILGKRPDGFHELVSVTAQTEWGDELVFQPRTDGEINLSINSPSFDQLRSCGRDEGVPEQRLGLDIPVDDRNLVVKAAKLLQNHAQNGSGLNIHMEKRVPPQSGLGGGSSDAAAVLVATTKLWRFKPDRPSNHELGAQLGSDVPLFFNPRASLVSGRGEIIQNIEVHSDAESHNEAVRLPVIIVRPPQGLSTPEVYRNVVVPAEPFSVEPFLDAIRQGDWAKMGALLFNRLQSAAEPINSGVGRILQTFGRIRSQRSSGLLGAGMTGSGSACFALFDQPEHAQAAVEIINRQKHGMTVLTNIVL